MTHEAGRPRTLADQRVLVVEDDDFTRKLLVRLLHDIKVRAVWEAVDGMSALEMMRARKGEVDLIICDLEMPKMGGLDFLHALRTAGGGDARLPVIVLTAHRDAETVKRVISFGISGYLVKPVSHNDLLKRLTFALQRDG